MTNNLFHTFELDTQGIALPQRFTYPFRYTPHPLCLLAVEQVSRHIELMGEWKTQLSQGKMLGVLVAQDAEGTLGYLAAFSGGVAGSNRHPYFVPPIYDLLQPNGEFKQGEALITTLNHRIATLQQSPQFKLLKVRLAQAVALHSKEQESYRHAMAQAKLQRNSLRNNGTLNATQQQQLTRESQFQKAELKRMKKRHAEQERVTEQAIATIVGEIDALKTERRLKSERLQERIYRLFRVNNARGEEKDLIEVFHHYFNHHNITASLPPSGSGECCAPKLLQCAYEHHLTPLCMAEFWWGKSPVGEIRHHGHYYPACDSKCKPLLSFMLQGLDVEPNPLASPQEPAMQPLNIVYEDEWLIAIDKPAGLLTVSGKQHNDCLQARLRQHCPTAMVVHRLDMDTSGLVLAAKDMATYKLMQAQFANHSITKCYIALLDGMVPQGQGTVSLPLRADIDNRPRQLVDPIHGKVAITHYKVIEHQAGHTRMAFTPVTGRTHQLRVHASSPQGLNCPIVGDMLYGKAHNRLHLHAQSLTFTHPITKEPITLTTPVPF